MTDDQCSYPRRQGDEVAFPRCATCNAWCWPTSEVCRTCGDAQIQPCVWSGTAVVVAEVTVHRGVAPHFLANGPFVLVKLDLGGLDFITTWRRARSERVPAGTTCGLSWGLGGWPQAELTGRAEHDP